MIALTILTGALIVIPVLIVGAGLGAAFGLLMVLARLVFRGSSLVVGADREGEDPKDTKAAVVRGDANPALHYGARWLPSTAARRPPTGCAPAARSPGR
jgi:hypothetical protein